MTNINLNTMQATAAKISPSNFMWLWVRVVVYKRL